MEPFHAPRIRLAGTDAKTRAWRRRDDLVTEFVRDVELRKIRLAEQLRE
jgi:hypothetical protein